MNTQVNIADEEMNGSRVHLYASAASNACVRDKHESRPHPAGGLMRGLRPWTETVERSIFR